MYLETLTDIGATEAIGFGLLAVSVLFYIMLFRSPSAPAWEHPYGEVPPGIASSLPRKIPLIIQSEGTTMVTFGLFKASGLVMDDLVVLKEALEKWLATPVSPLENDTSAAYREVGAQLLAEVQRQVSAYYSWPGADASALVNELQ
jgi:hypothetical protein